MPYRYVVAARYHHWQSHTLPVTAAAMKARQYDFKEVSPSKAVQKFQAAFAAARVEHWQPEL